MSSSTLPPIGPWSDDGPTGRTSATDAASPFNSTTPTSAVDAFAPAPSATSTASTAAAERGGAHAPIGFLFASLAASAAALVLAALFERPGTAIAAWALAGLGGLGLAVVFLMRDARCHLDPLYTTTQLPVWLYRACVLVALLGVVAASVRIALFVGRM